MRNTKAGKDIHIRISEQMAEKLRVMSEFQGQPDAHYAALLLEEIIAGKWHSFNVVGKRYMRLGLTGIDGDSSQ